MSIAERRKCEHPGCNSLGRNKGKYNGKTIYDRFCEQHHRLSASSLSVRRHIDNTSCDVCGWDKAACDRHRIIPELGYKEGNVKILCPNCHRLVTLGILDVGSMSIDSDALSVSA